MLISFANNAEEFRADLLKMLDWRIKTESAAQTNERLLKREKAAHHAKWQALCQFHDELTRIAIEPKVARKETPGGWSPTPPPGYDAEDLKAYNAGYSDGFHGYTKGSGMEDPTPAYRNGYRHGHLDRPLLTVRK